MTNLEILNPDRLQDVDVEKILEEAEKEVDCEEEENDLPDSKYIDLWKYRLYHDPKDDIVRKGDIIINEIDNQYSIIITADCDLAHFDKTGGLVNILQLTDVGSFMSFLSSQGKKVNSNFRKKIKNLSSFVNPMKIHGEIIVIPFVEEEKNYLLSSNAISFVVPEFTEPLADAILYSKWKNYNRITTINEPFLTKLIEKVFERIRGYGTPDYPEELKNHIENSLKEEFKNES